MQNISFILMIESRESPKTRVYPQRWWILSLFSLFTMWGCAVWNTWSPIADTAKKVTLKNYRSLFYVPSVSKTFGWSDSTLVLFNLWGVIMFFIFSPVSAYLLSVSLRYSVLGGTFLVFLGSTLR